MRIERRRLLNRGDIPGSNGGIYNPGVLRIGTDLALLCRREVDYRFTHFVFPELVQLDPLTLEPVRYRTLRPVGYPEGSRLEDFRCLTFNGLSLVVHTLVGPAGIKPVISRIVDDTLQLFDEFTLPIASGPAQKNWVLFEHAGALHCLYRLDPLTIFVLDGPGRWTLVKEEMNGWSTILPNTLSNSANLIPFEGGLLGFWHTVAEAQRYVQGAVFLDATLTLKYRTDVILDGGEIREGHKPGVLYVSSLLAHEDHVLAFYGEADAHTGVAIINRDELWAELQRSPFQPIAGIRLRYMGDSVSGAFGAMRVLHEFSAECQHPRIRLFVGSDRLRPTMAQLRTSNIYVHGSHEAEYDGALVDGSDRIEWQEPGRTPAIVDRARARPAFAGSGTTPT